jgi:hypothetical protein
MITDPQPLSITARGGNIIHRITRQIDMGFGLKIFEIIVSPLYDEKCSAGLQGGGPLLKIKSSFLNPFFILSIPCGPNTLVEFFF